MQPGQAVLASLPRASSRTWRLADGRGALSRGTASGAATRRGHALLSAPQVGPHAAWPAVSLLRFDDRVTPVEGTAIELTPAFMLGSRAGGAPSLTAPSLTARAGGLRTCASCAATPWPRGRVPRGGRLRQRLSRLL